MMNNSAPSVYGKLSEIFQRITKENLPEEKDRLSLHSFAAVEAVLYLLSECAQKADPTKAYLLFTQYQLIGTKECNVIEHTLQRARLTIGHYRSKNYWQSDLKKYRNHCYDAIRAFSIEETDGVVSFSKEEDKYPHPYEKRKEEWEQFWPEEIEKPEGPAYASKGSYKYVHQNIENGEAEKVSVKFDNEDAHTHLAQPDILEKGCRETISITFDELLKTAEKMSEISPNDPCHKILKTNTIKQVVDSSVKECDSIDINQVVNIVGMVGSGKTTLIKVLSFWCHQKGYRIAIVVDTVAEVLNLQKYFFELGVKSSPLIGRNERLKYINQVIQKDESCLFAEFSQYLTPCCLIDGMNEQKNDALSFGKEPCYVLKKDKKNHLCPHFDYCAGTKMLRECYTAPVVITTVAGFAAARVGKKRETFLELVMRDFDIVVFDESDRVQKNLDQFFMPETSFNGYIQKSGDDCKRYMELDNKARQSNPAEQEYNELQRKSLTVLLCIVKSLRYEMGSWGKIKYGEPFSALTLLEDLHNKAGDYQIPKDVYNAIHNLIDVQDESNIQQSALRKTIKSSCISETDDSFFEENYNAWIKEMGNKFPRSDKDKTRRIQDARIKLIIRLIFFDKFIRKLGDVYEASHEVAYGQNELVGFLQTRFLQQQFFLPSALCGNLFGLKKTEEDDIILFRQFAFGRSLMKDLPYLHTDKEGNPAGPHTILLSGSSWAEGSYEYHVNRPVNYILEADKEKREFLANTHFRESGFAERVSGAVGDGRTEALRDITKKSVELIIKEYNRKEGKILIVVNSYAQTREVQQTLEAELQKNGCLARVCRMISDAISIQDDTNTGTVRRGEVSRFAKMDADILIAPAMAIERGHNIVDESGHSALAAAFFMVRPMAVPDDIQQKGSKLNGFVEAHCQHLPNETLFEYNARIRQLAAQQWSKMSKNKLFGLAALEECEKKDIVATLFVLILQIFGRLARVTDTKRTEPYIYFMDGAFRRRKEEPNDFDCLSELGKYMDALMTRKESAEIAETLYKPFYESYKKEIQYE